MRDRPKHVEDGLGDELALRIVDVDAGGVDELLYSELDQQAGQCINYFRNLGLVPGDTVAGMLEPRPELYVTAIGCWLGGYRYMPLYSLFGPDAVNYRLDDADVKTIVTSSAHVDKIDPDAVDALEHVLVVDGGGDGEFHKHDTIMSYEPDYSVANTRADDTCTIQYTSGSTGPPKGVEVRHVGIVTLYLSFVWAADQRPTDEYFGAVPPAWSYGLFGCTAFPLHRGMETTTYRGKLTLSAVVDVFEKFEITNVFAPPTVEWVQNSIGAKIIDHYGFTEGAMVVNNYVFDG